MVDEQDRPIRAIFAAAADDSLAAIFDYHPTSGSAKGVSTGINRVGEKITHRRVDRKLPQYLMLSRDFGVDVWQRDLITSERQKHLADALHLGKTREDQPNR